MEIYMSRFSVMQLTILCVSISTAQLLAYEKSFRALRTDLDALEYCQSHKNAYIATIFPIATDNDEEIDKIFEKHGQLKYAKKIYLYDHGPLNFVLYIYKGHEADKGFWLGSYHND